MPTRIHEYEGDNTGPSKANCYPAVSVLSQSTITANAGSQNSAVFNARTGLVVIDTDEKIHIQFGVSPTATTATFSLPAGTKEAFNLPSVNSGLRVAIIAG